MMGEDRQNQKAVHGKTPWVALSVWIALLFAIDLASRRFGFGRDRVAYLVAAALASLALVTLIAFARLAGSPPELRTLRMLAVLLPSAFVLLIQLVLYFLEIDERVTEVGEHVVAVAVLSAGAIPFSVYVFREFMRLRDELARRAERLRVLHESSMSVTAELGLPRLHEVVAEGAREVVEADRAVLSLTPQAGMGGVVIVAAGGSLPVEESEEALIRSIDTTGQTGATEDGPTHRLGVAVRRRGRPVGAIVVTRDGGVGFDLESELLLDMFSVAAAAGIENALRLEEAQLLATVEERERIARDLHDDLGQLLGFLTAEIQATQELAARGRHDEAGRELARLEESTRTLGAQVREAILGLRARIGPDRPLGCALRDYVADFGIQAGLRTEMHGDAGAGRGLPGPGQYQLLRIAQEALSNARRHAGARRVVVSLWESEGHVGMSVADDGVGFSPDRVSGGGSGFGLKTMAERARILNGEFDIGSNAGIGTVVTVRVPVPGTDKD